MVKVRTFDTYFGIDYVEEATWGTDPGSGYKRLAFNSEDLHYEDDVFPDSEEFAALGGLLGIEKGRRIVRGSITVEPQYDTDEFWVFFSNCWSHEDLAVDKDVFAVTPVTVNELNTHVFTQSLTLPVGMTLRVWKSGPDTSGTVDVITGMLATNFTWEQPEGDRAKVTIEFIAKAITQSAASGLTLATAPSGPKKFKPVDFDGSVRTGGYANILFGNTLTSLNITGFTISVDRKIEAGTGFLPSLLTLDKPGIVGTRGVTLDITSVLEQNYASANKPAKEFIDGTQSRAVIVFESNDIAAATDSIPYAVRFDFPLLEWTDVRYGASQAGEIPFTATARGLFGALTNLGSYNDHAFPSGGSADVRCIMQTGVSDDGDAKYSALTGS